MILFCNTFITETKPSIGKGHVSRGNLKQFSNFDIFKYSLASLAIAYKWSKVILKISLDDIYKPRQFELAQFIREEFKDFDVILKWNRNEYQNDWKNDYDLLDDDLIWFYCNHDHIFFDSSQDYLARLVEDMEDVYKYKDELCSLQFSHWPENIRTAKSGGSSYPKDPTTYLSNSNHISVKSNNFDSIQIISKDLYYKWWFEGEFNHIKLPRPDFFGIGLAEIKPVPIHTVLIPLKEICRHFDGYQHVQPVIDNNQCPAIDIPIGFFENNIKIRYGYDDYKEGWTNINPKNEYYYAYDKSGTDYKFVMDSIPLVWKGKISEVDLCNKIDEIEMFQYFLQSILGMIYTSDLFKIDYEVEEKILRHYLKDTQFSIE